VQHDHQKCLRGDICVTIIYILYDIIHSKKMRLLVKILIYENRRNNTNQNIERKSRNCLNLTRFG
jgi:hypothetical protein